MLILNSFDKGIVLSQKEEFNKPPQFIFWFDNGRKFICFLKCRHKDHGEKREEGEQWEQWEEELSKVNNIQKREEIIENCDHPFTTFMERKYYPLYALGGSPYASHLLHVYSYQLQRMKIKRVV